MKADLSDVTLCAADSANLAATVRALQICLEQCKFGDAVLFTHELPSADGFRTVKIDKLDRVGYQAFRMKPPPTVETPFALFIEWDGYVIEPRMWQSRFREYDYVGARWPGGIYGLPDRTVGNSGFCLQSRKLHMAFADPRLLPVSNRNVDALVCGEYRPFLEGEYGIRFALESVADQFSFELVMPTLPTVGFHGLGNMFRYLDDREMMEVIESLDPYVVRVPQFVVLILKYALQSKFKMVEYLFGKMRECVSPDEALALFRKSFQKSHADELFGLCDRLMRW